MREQTARSKRKVKLVGVVKYVYKKMGKAILDYKMIENKDRIMVGVSGGKDSLVLVKLLQMRKRKVPVEFELLSCFVDVNFLKLDKQRLIEFFRTEGISLIVKELFLKEDELDCFWCSWNRRKILFETAQEYNCNKLALAHNLDDVVETIFMNLCFFGEVSGMKPKIELFGGKLTIIRPLCYVEKKDIVSVFSKLALPQNSSDGCELNKDKRRRLVKRIFRWLEEECPQVNIKKNVFNALKNVKKDYLMY